MYPGLPLYCGQSKLIDMHGQCFKVKDDNVNTWCLLLRGVFCAACWL